MQMYQSKLGKKEDLSAFLPKMTGLIRKCIAENPSMRETPRLICCTKIKFIRKAALELPFPISDKEMSRILAHPNFMHVPEEQ